ncbi:hypothetical protein [Actinoallomurus rhizosphaericola]|uniref:hypothetical protein n=1 Tax=Actinoallomurus rhizosphaericola TaxID=2952536 RepID=UPI00209081C6|nr:hypothetical protein [Actinoallomurus rhizosphaericola]MCO5994302.1 hypothetical protein [Actinoallomurus rhizosphaericola]
MSYPGALAEAVRRAGLDLMYGALGVPERFHAALRTQWFALTQPIADGELTTDAVCEQIERRGPEVRGFRYRLRLLRGFEEYARGGGEIRCLSPAVYRFIRAQQRFEPGEEFTSDRNDLVAIDGIPPEEVLLAAEGSGWSLVPRRLSETADHLPGAMLMAAAGQAVLASGGLRSISRMFGEFVRHAEVTAPVTLVVSDACDVQASQRGEVVFRAEVS